MNWTINFLSLALIIGIFNLRADTPYDPISILPTWQQDPTTTMTLDWVGKAEDAERPAILQYRKRGKEDWKTVSSQRRPFPFSDRIVDRVELTGLEPATAYDFRFGEDSRIYYFRTMPATLSKPLRFAVGGDTRHRQEWMEKTNQIAMEWQPEFVVWGGDFAYADGREERVWCWYEWFDAIKNTLITSEGRVIPIIGCIGNHEVRGGWFWRRGGRNVPLSDAFRESIAPYFYDFFAFPGHPGYNVLDFGNYMSLVILDTDHSGPIDGEQTEWLQATLEERSGQQHVFPVYHVPAFPSAREDSAINESIRSNWLPHFENHGVRVAFENHDHAYKRTVPIKGGKPNIDMGIIFVGDGCWGVRPRRPHDVNETWYLKVAKPERHAIIVTLHNDLSEYLVVNDRGQTIDSFEVKARKQ